MNEEETNMKKKNNDDDISVLKKGKFINFLKKGEWEYIERNNCSGVVVILPLTDEGNVILTEQYRPPVGKKVIGFPAGLVDDLGAEKKETSVMAAKRELLEETGYKASKMRRVMSGPSASGLSSEILEIYLAEGLQKVGTGGGDETESITVHEVHIDEVENWLEKKQENGLLVGPKVYAGLYWLSKKFKESSQ